MISPSARLLWLTGIIFIPTCALPAFVPHGERYIALAGTLIVILCLIDWLFSKRFLSGLIVTLPEI
ncbi:MAG: hypothetical protein JO211_17245, partial [Acidobacteriaceae bacterium]|nr:hypothetical protein [Acidobacteriaceae bacterium]